MRATVSVATLSLMSLTTAHTYSDGKRWASEIKPGRSIVRAEHGMVASSQPLASQVGLDVLKRGGNAVDASIAMAAVLNVTEPMMTGIGGDMFALVYWSRTANQKASTPAAARALNLDYFKRKGITSMPDSGMETITMPGAVDGWAALLEKVRHDEAGRPALPLQSITPRTVPGDGKAAADWATRWPVGDPASAQLSC
jgi:hypothetical protein